MMKATSIFVLIFVSFISFSQVNSYYQLKKPKPVKPAIVRAQSTNFGIGGGLTRSVLFLQRNINDNNDAVGYNMGVVYGGHSLWRASFDAIIYRPMNIEPTWYDVKAYTFEANLHLITRFADSKAFFYPLFGLSYNLFSGHFTGDNDYENLADKYEKNSDVTTNWLGVNAGVGMEFFFEPFSLFVDTKTRIGLSDGNKQLNIIDWSFGTGIRYNINVPTINKIFKGTRKRYHRS